MPLTPISKENTKKNLEKAGYHIQDDTLVLRSIRLYKSDIDFLEQHFKSQGLSLTAGVRQVLRNYINGL